MGGWFIAAYAMIARNNPALLRAGPWKNSCCYFVGQVVETTFTFLTVKVEGAPPDAAAPEVSSVPLILSYWPAWS